VAVVAVVAAVAAFLVTINAKFLEYPYWLGVQKADFILGPVFVGLYWHHRRPDNRLGLLMIALGLIFIPYALESIRSPYLFTIGTMVEAVYIPLALAIVLAFPNGRLEGRVERLILVGVVLGYTLPYLVWLLVSPEQLIPRLSLSGCRALCPRNPLAVWSTPSWYPQSVDFLRAALITVDLATVGLLVWKFVTGTPPRRRALAVGAPIAMCYLLAQSTYQTLQLVDAHFGGATSQNLNGPLQWVIAGFRAAPWYGFLFALIAAELFAGRVLRDVVRRSMGRPPLRELEGMLREPLGDPGLRLGFWRASTGDWVGRDGAVLEPPSPGRHWRRSLETAAPPSRSSMTRSSPKILSSCRQRGRLHSSRRRTPRSRWRGRSRSVSSPTRARGWRARRRGSVAGSSVTSMTACSRAWRRPRST